MKSIRSFFSAILTLITASCFANQGAMVKAPYEAPAIKSVDQDGKSVDFSEAYKKGITLVYFYPKADTPGCTKQGCSLRDAYGDLTEKGVQVFGVSVDQPEANKKFKDKYHLPFTLVSDPDGKVLEAFKVSKIPVIGLATRQAFLVVDGKVVWHDAKASTDKQAADVLAVLKEMGK